MIETGELRWPTSLAYWTAFFKTRFNYNVAGLSGQAPLGTGTVQIFQGRLELDF